ncbi:APC family permease [Rhodococcus sp. BP-349]|uniref:APC family permease n=1 Tax=unclassified Rhodococcus (in: high G+C Gram-positive bacteria) TaxID=192944 RepID=UPI001C9A9212|nr:MULTISPECIES: APC family permease [unclassified Rhodococcus (in: high G+C Gram-positive bacteria)]MBY6537922.1 APC family permease [Rhodococcus sp. BP-363]MBY6542259.1 APC family permease [Rhodococcus sp. BP-369]MBY6561489.1 APC family permease [Rhodococcus sp. BP-370]MBY6575781.1 APC family permease [Rhodococcus sp. BP-364]MBY6585082.1 APC family permease [Rhodococcus sp. BP-358]
MVPRTQNGTPQAEDATELAQGSLNVAHIVFMVMATVAPAGGAVAILPLAFGLGVGLGTPGMYVFVVVIMLLFAVGFTRMVPYVQNAGAFFAYIVRGLGRPVGLAGAYIASSAYIALSVATGGAMGFFAAGSMNKLAGIDLPWWIYTLAGLMITFLLGYRKITLAAGVLGVALVIELVVILVLDIAIIARNGFGSLPLESFSPSEVFVPGVIGVAMIFAFSCYQGFEGTAIYAEEARDPQRTVPRATYISMACIGLFFVLTSWAFLASSSGATAAAAASPGTFVYDLSDEFVGPAWTTTLEVLIVTSCFAGMLAFHNAASRYLFALGRDGFLPRSMRTLHPRHQSPVVAGSTSYVIETLVIVAFALAGLDPLTNLSSSLTGFGAVGLMVLITTTSLAVLVFFARQRQFGWARTVAPTLALIGFGTITYFALSNFPAITGTDSAIINGLPLLHVVTIVVAIGVALHARRNRPESYANMGRTLVD